MAEPLLKKLAPGQARYIAKVYKKAQGKGTRTLWGVYDVAMASWPGYRGGRHITQDLTEAQAEELAAELNQETS